MGIQWGRAVLGAFLMEVALVGIAVPLFVSGHSGVNLYAIPPAYRLSSGQRRSPTCSCAAI